MFHVIYRSTDVQFPPAISPLRHATYENALAYANEFLKQYPGSTVEVVEVCPATGPRPTTATLTEETLDAVQSAVDDCLQTARTEILDTLTESVDEAVRSYADDIATAARRDTRDVLGDITVDVAELLRKADS